jgi:hypothetical protein
MAADTGEFYIQGIEHALLRVAINSIGSYVFLI